MDKSTKTILVILAILIVAFIVMAQFAPKPLDWSPKYNTKDKDPLGLFVLDQEIDSFLRAMWKRIKTPLNDYFYTGIFEDSTLYNYNLLYINQQNRWGKQEVENICHFVREGNSVFLSSAELSSELMDSLGLTYVSISYDPASYLFKQDTFQLSFYDTCSYVAYVINAKGFGGSYFTSYDTIKTTELGNVSNNFGSDNVNFIEVQYGSGLFYIHLEPAVFTNYYLLTDNYHRYAETALNYIPAYHDIIWSLYDQTSKVISDSPFGFIKSQPPLYWAWLLLIFGGCMFVLFNIRRIQRVIKILPKLPNTSIEFAKTIGNLYYLEGDIRNIMDKQIIYLLEKIRSDFHINTDILDEKFEYLLQARTGHDATKIKKMIFLINKHLNTDYTCTEDDLKRLNTAIENVFNQ
ncbi:MAG: hypothetical protein IPO92_09990 [Saprospiraceae bacterium]|nr:hypothetical protein [Saprospiraceae bacterium]